MWPNLQFHVDLVIFTEEILNGNLFFLCSVSKIKRTFWNYLVEAANVCNVLPRLDVSNSFTVIKLIQDLTVIKLRQDLTAIKLRQGLKYRDHVYFERVRAQVINHEPSCLQLHDKFYEDILIGKGLSNEGMFRFCNIVEMQGENESVNEKIISDEKK